MNVLSAVAARFRQQIANAQAPLRDIAEKQLNLQALALAKTNRDRLHLEGLHQVEFCASSQWGEDGIIDWLVERLPDIAQTFVEFGVENYRESNTRLLLQMRNWRGLVLDGSKKCIADIKSQNIYWRHQLLATCAFIDKDNINRLIDDAGFSGEIGLLSIDIDGNDYWVWNAINVINPAIVVCEYNAVFGDQNALTVPYRADFQRALAHHSMLYFGASLPAVISLGKAKGYTFVGTNSAGCNAFFVRNDLAPDITKNLHQIWAFPSKFHEARDNRGNLLFSGGGDRADLISQTLVVKTTSKKSNPILLGDLGDLYSDEWRTGKAIKT